MTGFQPPRSQRLYRSRVHRKLAGVCGGIAEFFGIDPALIRAALIFVTLLGGGGVLIYLVAALLLDDNPYQ